jgi:hypothetical protein
MKTAYLEPSAINWYVNSAYAGDVVAAAMAGCGYRPVVGLHTIYELARTFMDANGHVRGQTLFRFVQDLDPAVSPGSSALMVEEIHRLRTGTAVLPFLDHLNQAATRLEIARLAGGVFDDRARGFIERREQEVEEHHPHLMRQYISYVNELRSADSEAVPRLSLFEDAVKRFHRKVPELIRDLVQREVTDREALRLSEQLDHFPAIRSGVRANLYLMWICIANNVVPAFDKLDDYRHIIEASYADALVTEDEQLRRTAPRIHTGLELVAPVTMLSTNTMSAG